jgi:hypothetical protein
MEHAARTVAQVFADYLQRLHRIAHALLGLQRDQVKNILAALNRNRHRDCRGFPWAHLFSRFWLICRNRNFCFVHYSRRRNFRGAVRQRAPVKIVDPHLVVVADARRKRASKFRVKSAGHLLRITKGDRHKGTVRSYEFAFASTQRLERPG